MEKSTQPLMAGFFERLLALIIDGFIVSIGSYIFIIPLALVGGGVTALMYTSSNSSVGAGGLIMALAAYLLAFLIPIIYFIYFYTQKGQTLGKKVMNIKVVRVGDHSYMSWGRVLLREIVGKFVSGFLFGLGYFWYFSSEKRQAWHDSIADTIVVKTDPSGNILSGGPKSYPQERAKTFVPCGCFALFYVAIIFGLIAMGVAMSSVGGAKKGPSNSAQKYTNQRYQYDIPNKPKPSPSGPTTQ